MTVKELAKLLNLPIDILLDTIQSLGIVKDSENEKITLKEKNALIAHLPSSSSDIVTIKSVKQGVPVNIPLSKNKISSEDKINNTKTKNKSNKAFVPTIDVDIKNNISSAPKIDIPLIKDIKTESKKIQVMKIKSAKEKIRGVHKPIIFIKEGLTVENFINSTHITFQTITPFLDEWSIKKDLKTILSIEEVILLATSLNYSYVTSKQVCIFHDYSNCELKHRAPIITLMGHVDHGKTSILDYIRKTHLVKKELGGITQKLGAYTASYKNQALTFLDTPGHKAFSAIRHMGSTITDIVVLVVAADSGLQPQTIEAIEYINSKKSPTIVAINKVDRPHPPIENLYKSLAAHNIFVEQYGGDIQAIPISAKTGEGMDDLLEAIIALSDMLDLKAYSEGPAEGIVIETRIDHRIGAKTSLIIKNGVLHQGDVIICGKDYSSIKSIKDEFNNTLKSAGPSIPVEVTGLDIIEKVGIEFTCVKDIKTAKSICDFMKLEEQKLISENHIQPSAPDILSLLENIKNTSDKNNIILIADSKGSLDALKKELGTIALEHRHIKLLRESIGNINETDLEFAHASNSIILAFNAQMQTPNLNRKHNVHIIQNNIVYRIIEELEKIFIEREKSEVKEILGTAKVIAVFQGADQKIAGCKITSGKLTVNTNVKISRDSKELMVGYIRSIRHLKLDIKEAKEGTECGIVIRGYNPKIGDEIEYIKG